MAILAASRSVAGPKKTLWVEAQRFGQRLLSCNTALCGNREASAKLANGPGLHHFLATPGPSAASRLRARRTPEELHPYITDQLLDGSGKKVFFDVYGCQMNVNDTEVVWSILQSKGYAVTSDKREADIWILVTCSIREGAENKVLNKLRHIASCRRKQVYRPDLKVALLGCMAERLKEQLLSPRDGLVDVVVGPDAYRDLPRLLAICLNSNHSTINVQLSVDETYADVMPSRLSPTSVTGFVSIQRGCDNMCSFCIVPFTRGRERSRPAASILDEVRHLADQGVKEITLLGQNVNSYCDASSHSVSLFTSPSLDEGQSTRHPPGFKTIYRPKVGGVRFADLLNKVAETVPDIRIRFTSPHPKDFPDEVLQVVRSRANVCKQLHIPAQSGSSRVLEAMRRGYSREAYLQLVQHIRASIPGVHLSGDLMAGFCGETDADFEDTLDLIRQVHYRTLFLFPYSLREKTHAHRHLVDDVPQPVKLERFQRMVSLHRAQMEADNQLFIGTTQLVLIEGDSKRSTEQLQGRADCNTKVILPKGEPHLKPGDFCTVLITGCSSQVLKGQALQLTSISQFSPEPAGQE